MAAYRAACRSEICRRVSVIASIFLACSLNPSRVAAGPNAGGVAWLSWSSEASAPSGIYSWTSNVSTIGSTATLFVHFSIPGNAALVGTDLAYGTVGPNQHLTLLSMTEPSGATCGYVSAQSQVNPNAFGQTFPTSIRLSDPSHRCFGITFNVTDPDSLVAELRLQRFWVQDSSGAIDSLTVLGNATVRLGVGIVSPGIIVRLYGSPEQTMAAVRRAIPSHALAQVAQYEFHILTQPGMQIATASLVRSPASFPATVTHADTAAGSTTCRVDAAGLSTGAYDVVYTTHNGTSAVIPNALRLAERPSYLDTLSTSIDSLVIPFASLSCPTRVVALPSSGPVGGGIYDDGYCYQYRPGNRAYCDLSVYPSYYDNTVSGGSVTLTQSAMYKILDCNDNPIPNRLIAVEVHRAASSAAHCHESFAPEVGSAIRDPDPNHGAGNDIACVPIPGGGYRCTGSTGSDGQKFVILHKWPMPSGILNVLMYETQPGGQFYNAQDTVFRFCMSQAPAMVDQVFDLRPDTLELVGGKRIHSLGLGSEDEWDDFNHSGRAGMKNALYSVARTFRSNYPKRIYVNDIALFWGGLFDINGDWIKPHKDHGYGWTVDIRTHLPQFPWPNCASNPPAYTRSEIRHLWHLLNTHFRVFTHVFTPTDPTCPHFHCTLRKR